MMGVVDWIKYCPWHSSAHLVFNTNVKKEKENSKWNVESSQCTTQNKMCVFTKSPHVNDIPSSHNPLNSVSYVHSLDRWTVVNIRHWYTATVSYFNWVYIVLKYKIWIHTASEGRLPMNKEIKAHYQDWTV